MEARGDRWEYNEGVEYQLDMGRYEGKRRRDREPAYKVKSGALSVCREITYSFSGDYVLIEQGSQVVVCYLLKKSQRRKLTNYKGIPSGGGKMLNK